MNIRRVLLSEMLHILHVNEIFRNADVFLKRNKGQGCQIFRGTTYQNGKNMYTK
jgi:hypothetical protein